MHEPRSPEHDTVVIVLVGSFSPKIFQPAWFAAQELIPPSEGTEADIQVISNDYCSFETSWFRLEVLSDRWQLTSLATPFFEGLRDLTLGTFKTLGHTPIGRIGLNAIGHFALPDRDAQNSLGHQLAPKEVFWTPVLKNPGTLSLTIQGERPDEYEGAVRVKVEPSSRVADGIYIDVNDEYFDNKAIDSSWALKTLQDQWDSHRDRVQEVRDNIMNKAWEGK